MSHSSRDEYVLSSFYGLNFSYSKFIRVGLRRTTLDSDGKVVFVATVQLGNSSGLHGVTFGVDEWRRLLENFEKITAYLDSDDYQSLEQPMLTEKHTTLLTVCMGGKAVIFDKRVSKDASAEHGPSNAGEPPKKKRKHYESTVILKKPTFDGLKSLRFAVDLRLRYLEQLVDAVNACWTVMRGNSGQEREQLRDIVIGAEELKKHKICEHPFFVETVFEELYTLM